jgi:acetyl-CoA synthetase
VLHAGKTYDALVADFAWSIPDDFNIANQCCTRWAKQTPERMCLLHYNHAGLSDALTYGALEAQANALAWSLRQRGIKRGDRVALLMPQGFATVVAHMAIYKLAAIAVPLALLFGEDALAYRLSACGARAIVTNAMGRAKLLALKHQPKPLQLVVLAEEPSDMAEGDEASTGIPEIVSLATLLANGTGAPSIAESTDGDTPAMMIFTSGTTGPPKGALHGHRVLIGHLPGVQMHHELLPQEGDRLWTPADWAWAGGLLNVLLPGLYFGVPVVSSPAQKFDAHTAFRIMETMAVRNAFIPPTALRMLRGVDAPPEGALKLRTIGSGGEALGAETLAWGERVLGLTINEFYGQTECNLVLASSAAIGVSRPGAIGKPVPGHRVGIIDSDGREVPVGQPGQIAVLRPDPVMFLTYWQDEAATAAKFIGDWMLTGDQGVMDQDGYVSFYGRDDDVITSAGYRIGPTEIEDCLHAHEAVQIAAAIGKPDAVRTEIVKVFVVLRPGYEGDAALATELRDWVKFRLSAHEYPREVEFVDSLPLTTTGKVIRRELRERERRGS